MLYSTRIFRAAALALTLLSTFGHTAEVVAAVWETSPSEATNTKNPYAHGLGWDEFSVLINKHQQNGLRLENLAAYVDWDNGKFVQKWAGSWRPGTDSMNVKGGYPLSQFLDQNAQEEKAGLKIVVARPYHTPSGNLVWAGIWRSGSSSVEHKLIPKLTQVEFESKVLEMHPKGMRISDVFSYVEKGIRYYGGIWRPGNDALYIRIEMTADELATWHAYYHNTRGLTMTSLQVVEVDQGEFPPAISFIAVWRGWKGKDKGNQYFEAWDSKNPNVIGSKVADLHKEGLVLTTFSYADNYH